MCDETNYCIDYCEMIIAYLLLIKITGNAICSRSEMDCDLLQFWQQVWCAHSSVCIWLTKPPQVKRNKSEPIKIVSDPRKMKLVILTITMYDYSLSIRVALKKVLWGRANDAWFSMYLLLSLGHESTFKIPVASHSLQFFFALLHFYIYIYFFSNFLLFHS